jgi:hypothetical protein
MRLQLDHIDFFTATGLFVWAAIGVTIGWWLGGKVYTALKAAIHRRK